VAAVIVVDRCFITPGVEAHTIVEVVIAGRDSVAVAP
jgi:hypothetical protein